MNVLIADDEKIVLEGLKYIIDWNRLGFTICRLLPMVLKHLRKF